MKVPRGSGPFSWLWLLVRGGFRNHGELDAAIARQEPLRGRADVGRREGAVPREVLVEPVRIACRGVIRVQLIGLAAEAADPFHAAEERRFDLIDRPVDFVRTRRFLL